MVFKIKLFGRTLSFGKVDIDRLEKRVDVLEKVVVKKHRDIETLETIALSLLDNYDKLMLAMEAINLNQKRLNDPLGYDRELDRIPSAIKRFDRYEAYTTIPCLKQRLGFCNEKFDEYYDF